MDQPSIPGPTIAYLTDNGIIAYIYLVTAMSPLETASHPVTVAVHVIIMMDISIATVAKDSLL